MYSPGDKTSCLFPTSATAALKDGRPSRVSGTEETGLIFWRRTLNFVGMGGLIRVAGIGPRELYRVSGKSLVRLNGNEDAEDEKKPWLSEPETFSETIFGYKVTYRSTTASEQSYSDGKDVHYIREPWRLTVEIGSYNGVFVRDETKNGFLFDQARVVSLRHLEKGQPVGGVLTMSSDSVGNTIDPSKPVVSGNEIELAAKLLTGYEDHFIRDFLSTITAGLLVASVAMHGVDGIKRACEDFARSKGPQVYIGLPQMRVWGARLALAARFLDGRRWIDLREPDEKRFTRIMNMFQQKTADGIEAAFEHVMPCSWS